MNKARFKATKSFAISKTGRLGFVLEDALSGEVDVIFKGRENTACCTCR
jgi:hypothetical protein